MTTEMQRTEVAASADGTTKATTSKWLSGIYAPVAEEVTAFDLPVRGELPPELDGRYVRNGPNPMSAVDPATHHWFVGDAMVHGVRLRDGKAEWYRNRWVRSTAISAALGEEPAPGERHGGMETANTNVIGLAGRTYAIVEAGARPVELSTELDTICHSDLDGTLPHGYTAHPKVDPVTGNVHAIAYRWALPHLEYVVIGPDGRVLQIEAIAVAGGPMVHDCSITERWVVVYDLPVTFDLETAMAGASFPYRWNEGRTARVGILPLGGLGTDVRWFEVEPCYVFHPMNAYDDGDGSCSTWSVTRACSTPTRSDPTTAHRSCGGGRSTRPPARSTRNSARTWRWSSPGSTSGGSAGRTGGVTPPRWGSPTATSSVAGCCASTCPQVRPARSTWATIGCRGSG